MSKTRILQVRDEYLVQRQRYLLWLIPYWSNPFYNYIEEAGSRFKKLEEAKNAQKELDIYLSCPKKLVL